MITSCTLAQTSARVLRPLGSQRGSGSLRHHVPHVLRALSDSDDQGPAKITRDSEPDEPWGSKYEQKGINPMQDPVAIIGAVGLLFPFILLGIFAATGVIDLSGQTR